MANLNSALAIKLSSGFRTIRDELRKEEYRDRWERPLAYWALPGDRRLPLALLDRTLGVILHTPFEQLATVPGIGDKKLYSLIMLMHRAAKMPFSSSVLLNMDAPSHRESEDPFSDDPDLPFNPSTVSEGKWAAWRDTVAHYGVGDVPLGRLTASLQEMPSVIWKTPMNSYFDISLAEMRQLKTHGEKRVRMVLETFALVYSRLMATPEDDRFAMRLSPGFVAPIESWIQEAVDRTQTLTLDDIRKNVIGPLVDQIKVDAGPDVYRLVSERLGISGTTVSVRSQAMRMAVTRARVYQLLDECANIMEVRWPEGRGMFDEIEARLIRQRWMDDKLMAFDSLRDLFYPRPKIVYRNSATV